MKWLFTFLIGSVCTPMLFAQFQDDFSDGDFTNNPEWFGDVDRFSVENEVLRLTHETGDADQSYLATESQAIENAVWEFYVEMGFQPSGSNLTRVYLVSNSPDLTGSLNGYFVMVGDTPREISLYKQEGTSTTKIIDGEDGTVATNPVNSRIRVTRDNEGNWELFSDVSGGTDFISEGTTFDNTFVQGFYFGVRCTYTATRSELFYFDDFNVTGDPFFDPNPPTILNSVLISQTEVDVFFDKPLEAISASTTTNYFLDNGIGNPSTAERDETNFSLVRLTFSEPFEIGVLYTLTVDNVEDFSGNVTDSETTTFQYIEAQTPVYGDIIINEFMPRESPAIGLPERQYVEIYNRSDKFFHLNGWKLSDRTGTGTIQDEWIHPGEYLLLVPTSALPDYPEAINVTNWQSLNNTGDDIVLETNDSILVDKLTYTNNWYQDENKSNGGYSIERINPMLNCSGAENWRASNDALGGTPGTENSVFDLTPDTSIPQLIEVFALSSEEVRFVFDKGMDSMSLINAELFTNPTTVIQERKLEEVYPKEMLVLFENNAIIPGTIYDFELNNVSDCSGNTSSFSGNFVLPQNPIGDEIIINEILHNTLTGGSDFVELYNRSDKHIDLMGWQLANFSNDTISAHRTIEINYILAPDDYVVVTRDSTFQIMNYPYAVPGKFIQLDNLPSYTNTGSTVYLIHNDEVIDEVAYTSDWHFKLLQSQRGVSLERFDPFGVSNDKNNWHSASETVGFATPGRKNSQVASVVAEGTLTLSSKSFSPDNDGHEDVLLIRYDLTDPEMLGDLNVYDDMGRKIRTLLSSHLLGAAGTIKWDGIRDDGNKASIGPYIILFEALNTETAEKIAIRKVVTLAGRL